MRASVTLASADSPGSVFTMWAALGSPVRRSSSVRSSSFSSRSGCIVVRGPLTAARLGLARPRRHGQRVESLLDVDEVVDRVVHEVAGEGLHREPGAVAAVAGALPGVTPHTVEPVGEGPGSLGDR